MPFPPPEDAMLVGTRNAFTGMDLGLDRSSVRNLLLGGLLKFLFLSFLTQHIHSSGNHDLRNTKYEIS